MSYKVRIPEHWLKARPNLAKVPHLYTIDQAVGIGCANKPDDVMLIQFMLLKWEYTNASGITVKHAGNSVFGDVPVHGKWDMATLGFMLMFQLRNSVLIPVNGRFDPIDFKQLPSGQHALVFLNGILLDQAPEVFRDLSVASGIPAQLARTLKGFD